MILVPTNTILAQEKKQTLAVLEFEGYGVDQFAVKTLTDRFRSQAVADGSYRIMERGAMDEILSEQKLQLSGCTSDECIVEIGKFLGVQYMLGATVGRVGDTYAMSMRMISVESGEIIKTANFDMTGKIDRLLTEGIAEAARLIFGTIKKADAQIAIVSDPVGARLVLDGLDRGKTPIDLKDLKAETPYQMTLTLDRYKVLDTTLVLQEGRNSRLTLPLNRETGVLHVEGTPENSSIFLDKSNMGKLPLQAFSYPTGAYQLKVQKPGFHAFSQSIVLESDQELQIQVQLLPKSRTRAMLFSILLPGSGQLYQGYKGRGILLMISALASGYLSYQDYGNFESSRDAYNYSRDDYNNEPNPDLWESKLAHMNADFDTMKADEKAFFTKVGILGAVWTINIIEVTF